MALAAYESDPRLLLFTSLTAGSSHIITATSRLETILKANKIPFLAIDLATDEGARRLWQRRGGGKKLPGLVREGFVVGDLEQVEEWNEFGELKENIGPVPPITSSAATASVDGGSGIQGVNIRPPEATSPSGKRGVPGPGVVGPPKSPIEHQQADKSLGAGMGVALPGAAEIKERAAAAKAGSEKKEEVKEESKAEEIKKDEEPASAAKALLKEDHPGVEHLSAPPSALQSGTATPAVAEESREKIEAGGAKREQEEKKDEVEHTKHETTIQWKDEAKPSTTEESTSVEKPSIVAAATEEGQREEDSKDVAKGVEALEVEDKDTEKTQDQEVKDAEDATKSVQD